MSDKLVRICNRYDTADNWETDNPILSKGEIGIDSTNNIIKVGNGTDNWKDLELIIRSCHNNIILINEEFADGSGAGPTIKNVFAYKHPDGYNALHDNYYIAIDIPGYMTGSFIINADSDVYKTHSVKMVPMTDANIAKTDIPSIYITTDLSSKDDEYNLNIMILASSNSKDGSKDVLGVTESEDLGMSYLHAYIKTTVMSF